MHVTNNHTKEFKKRQAWEAVNGKIPEGHVITSLDGNIDNMNIENLACISYSVMRVMACNKLYSSNPETTKAGIAIAMHRVATLRLIDKAVEQNRSLLPEKIESPISCKKCVKIKCKYWHITKNRKRIPPSCKKHNLTIKEIEALIVQNKENRRGRREKKVGIIDAETYKKMAKPIRRCEAAYETA